MDSHKDVRLRALMRRIDALRDALRRGELNDEEVEVRGPFVGVTGNGKEDGSGGRAGGHGLGEEVASEDDSESGASLVGRGGIGGGGASGGGDCARGGGAGSGGAGKSSNPSSLEAITKGERGWMSRGFSAKGFRPIATQHRTE